MRNSRKLLVRQWALVEALSAARYGLSVRQLVQRMGVSKQTLYRDLAILRDAGVSVVPNPVNGEARYRLRRAAELPPLSLTPLQVCALHLARAELEPLAGSGLVEELDRLLARFKAPENQQSFHFPTALPGKPDVLRVLEQALTRRRRARIEYRSANGGGKPASIRIEPVAFAVAGGRPYVRAYCVERAEERTYKLDRVAKVELTAERATYRARAGGEPPFVHAVKAWSGELTEVAVKLDPDVAWRAEEYPLVTHQTVQRSPDGSAIIRARVAGVVETSRWVLAWGGAAEALEPPSLRELVSAELAKAGQKYPGLARTSPPADRGPSGTAVLPKRRSGRLTQAGTGEV